ncbi:stigma-specific STIG1-like protein 1 [Mercurialis annua]|uniref:stigma-specific STIG1-like protein 1 n=1 Tax=Mercurialis annua TaxID=3986 RepID=UPI0021603C5C|nr:stigma-specific STIG1-like protein 1 [Mercurialis annua]
MKLLKIFLILVIFMSLLLVLSISALPHKQEEQDEQQDLSYELTEQSNDDEINEVSSEHQFGRVLYQKKFRKPRRVRCNKYPTICHAKGSPGPHCCKKKCVNVLTDRVNCGACGKKCKYNQICCNGNCVNPSFSRGHCGGCNNRCKNGGFCAFGLCNYA